MIVRKHTGRKPIGQILLENGVMGDQQLQQALQFQARNGGVLGQILIDLGFITEEDRLKALASQSGMEVVDLEDLEIDKELLEMVTSSVANIYRLVPVSFEDNVLTVAMADPLNVNALDDLRFMLGCEVVGAVSNEESVASAIEKYYGSETESIDELIRDIDSVSEP